MDMDESFKKEESQHKCYICSDEFTSKDHLKKHRKKQHTENVQVCEKFAANKCDRVDEHCWYNHISSESKTKEKSKPLFEAKTNQDFREAPQDSQPPDQIQKMMMAVNNLCLKVEKMEKIFADLMN